jgi:hypothetical protein
LLECAIALAAGGVLLAALHGLLVAVDRARRLEAERLDTRRAVRGAAAVLRAELAATSARSGDLLGLTDSTVAIRAARGLGVVCEATAGSLVVDSAEYDAYRAPDPSRDVVRVFLEGDTTTTADDAWTVAALTGVAAGRCPSGRAGVSLGVAGLGGAVVPGAPLVVEETVEYRAYLDQSGLYWLGVRGRSGATWATVSPVAGPLRRGDGLILRALDATGAATTRLDSVATFDIALRARSPRLVHVGRGVLVAAQDSLRIAVGLVR